MGYNSSPSGCRASHGKILRTEKEALIDLIPELFFIIAPNELGVCVGRIINN